MLEGVPWKLAQKLGSRRLLQQRGLANLSAPEQPMTRSRNSQKEWAACRKDKTREEPMCKLWRGPPKKAAPFRLPFKMRAEASRDKNSRPAQKIVTGRCTVPHHRGPSKLVSGYSGAGHSFGHLPIRSGVDLQLMDDGGVSACPCRTLVSVQYTFLPLSRFFFFFFFPHAAQLGCLSMERPVVFWLLWSILESLNDSLQERQ